METSQWMEDLVVEEVEVVLEVAKVCFLPLSYWLYKG